MAHVFTPGCPRCADLEYGKMRTTKNHSDLCRITMYRHFERNSDPQLRAIKHLLDKLDAPDMEEPMGPAPATPTGLAFPMEEPN